MRKLLVLVAGIFLISQSLWAQNDLSYPVDVEYNEILEVYYVSNWADGDGFISIVNQDGEITGTLFNDLTYPGGLCLEEGILYVTDNSDLYGGTLPSYLVAIDILSGNEISRVEVSTDGTYLDLIDSDNNGYIYICDSEMFLIHRYDMETQEVEVFEDSVKQPYGVCYDHIHDRIIFTSGGSSLSFLNSISTEGEDRTKEFYLNGWIEGVIMNDVGEFFISSWTGEGSAPWGNEPVYKLNSDLNWKYELTNDQNRPFGMCLGHEKFLVICNWGSHSLNFFDLTPFGTPESSLQAKGMKVFPNPGNGVLKLSFTTSVLNHATLRVMDINGKQVFIDKLQFDGSAERDINLNHLSPGIYVLVVQAGRKLYREKLVIQ